MPPPQRPPFPSAPSEPSLRRLGVGSSRGGGERPLRAQLVVALVVGFVLLAVPLFLWRRPGGTVPANSEPTSGRTDAGMPSERDSGVDAAAAAPAKPERVRLSPLQRVRCSVSSRVRGQQGTLCDALPFFEKALAEAIKKNVDCAPHPDREGTISYALQIDFKRRWFNVFPGASGSWKGPLARRAVDCAERSIPKPEWETITHQYNYYMIAILATFAPTPKTPKVPGPSNAPTFE
jgi:hypothetical protein